MTKKTILAVLGFWAAAFSIGWIVGNANSPNYTAKDDVEDYIEKHTSFSTFTSLVVDQSREVTSVGVPVKRVEKIATNYNAGRYSYGYVEGMNKPAIKTTNVDYELGSSTNGMTKSDWLAVFGAIGIPTTGVSLVSFSNSTQTMTAGQNSVKVVAVLLGFGFGYYLGYKDEFDANTAMPQAVIADANFWEGVIKRYRAKPKIGVKL